MELRVPLFPCRCSRPQELLTAEIEVGELEERLRKNGSSDQLSSDIEMEAQFLHTTSAEIRALVEVTGQREREEHA